MAAWSAGNLVKNATINAGTLYIISPANANGAKNNTRYVTGSLDLNRIFPGHENGDSASRVAGAIFAEIKEADPDFLFDLHEAKTIRNDRDFLGSSLIFTELKNMEDVFFKLLLATENSEICSEPFNYFSPGPK